MTTNGNNTTASTNTSADTQGDAGTLAHLRESASHAYESTRESAATAAARASEGIEANPLAVLAGGIALGAILGALLPKSESEQKVLARSASGCPRPLPLPPPPLARPARNS